MNKKILTILLILVALSTIAIVSAQDTQTISGVEFNVPDGYTYDAEAGNTFLDSLENRKVDDVDVFTNDAGEVGGTIFIMIYNEDPGASDFPSDYEFENKTINGKKGTFMSAHSRGNIGFQYADGDKYIFIQALDEDVLKEVIIE